MDSSSLEQLFLRFCTSSTQINLLLLSWSCHTPQLVSSTPRLDSSSSDFVLAPLKQTCSPFTAPPLRTGHLRPHRRAASSSPIVFAWHLLHTWSPHSLFPIAWPLFTLVFASWPLPIAHLHGVSSTLVSSAQPLPHCLLAWHLPTLVSSLLHLCTRPLLHSWSPLLPPKSSTLMVEASSCCR